MTDLAAFTPRSTPGLVPLEGRRVRLEPFDPALHRDGLFAAIGGPDNAPLWEWMPVGPFLSADELAAFLTAMRDNAERWRTMVIRSEATQEILGSCTYMRLREAHGSAEIGCVAFGPKLRRTPEASEALYLMAAHVFALGYRRYEWKCNNANLASKRSAERFGFTFEGIFRNDMVTKGRSRDTAWYSITDTEWPRVNAALSAWLAPNNFGPDGAQKRTLESLRTL